MQTVFAWAHNPAVSQFVVMAADADNPTVWLFNLGTAGVWLACLLMGVVVTGRQYSEKCAELDATKKELADERREKDQLRDQLMRTLPSLSTAAQVMANQAVPVIQHADQQQVQLAQVVAELVRRVEALSDNE